MRESQIEKKVVEWAKAHNWLTYKLGGLGDRGKPDRVFLHQHVVLFMEFKASAGGVASPLQLWHGRQLAQKGYSVHFISDPVDGICILQTEGEPYE